MAVTYAGELIGAFHGGTLVLRPKILDHVGLKVTDMDKTLHFYQQLGLTLLRTSVAERRRSAVRREPDGLVLFFPTYQAASYADGSFVVRIPYEKIAGLMQKVFMDALGLRHIVDQLLIEQQWLSAEKAANTDQDEAS